jgi:hypothetical protein
MSALVALEHYGDCQQQIMQIVYNLCKYSLACLQFFVNEMLKCVSPSTWWLSKPILCVFFDATRYLQAVDEESKASKLLLSALSASVDIGKNIQLAADLCSSAQGRVAVADDSHVFDRILCRQLLEIGVVPRVSDAAISFLLEDCVSAPPLCMEQSILHIISSYTSALVDSRDAECSHLQCVAAEVLRMYNSHPSALKESVSISLHPAVLNLAQVLFSLPNTPSQSLSLLCDVVYFCSPVPVRCSRAIAGFVFSSPNFVEILEARDHRTLYTLKCLRLLADHDTGVATQQLLQHALFAFSCTHSQTDDEIRKIIAHCEANGFLLASEGYSWGTLRSSRSDREAMVTALFDSRRVMQCAQAFPASADLSVAEWNRDVSSLYDPAYIVAMVEAGIRELNDIKILPQMIESGILALSIKMTASAKEKIRANAYSILALVLSLFQSPSASAYPQLVVDFSQIQMLLLCLKNSVTSPLQQLPNLFAAMIAESVVVLGRPSHPLFETFTRLLLRSPTLDVTDLNWVSVVLGNDSVEFKSHMMWSFRVLKHGVAGELDIACLRRRRLVAGVCNLYDSRACDNSMRSSIRDVLFNIASHRLGASHLIDHCGIYPWCIGLIPTRLQGFYSAAELRVSHLQRGEQEFRFSLRLANRCSRACICYGRPALLVECGVLLLSSFPDVFCTRGSLFSAIKSTAKSWLQLAEFALNAKRSGLKGGGDMPVFLNVDQLHTLLSFAHRAHFLHNDGEFVELVLSVMYQLPGSWLTLPKWMERKDSLSELLSSLLHCFWHTRRGVVERGKAVVALVLWMKQVPVVKNSVEHLLSDMIIAVWRWLSHDQRELIKPLCPSAGDLLLLASEAKGEEDSEPIGNRKRSLAAQHTPPPSSSTKSPKL